MKAKKIRISRISALHYYKLVFRSVLFLGAMGLYIHERVRPVFTFAVEEARYYWLLMVIWVVYALEMVLRLFPSRLESPGCQKQFARNYIKSGQVNIHIQDNNATVLVALVWIWFNAIFGALYIMGIFDEGIMLILSSLYSVCDMICILFFCPFQTWFLKNKCCSACRIYNWDYAMMFTPLFFVRRSYAWSLLALSVALLVRWEITFFLHPERFSEKTNEYLRCKNCTEKLCAHKKQLMTLWQQIEEYTARRVRALRK